MTGPDIKQLKENFDKFSKSLEESEVDENVEEEIVEQKKPAPYNATPYGKELQSRVTAAKTKYSILKQLQQENNYWLRGVNMRGKGVNLVGQDVVARAHGKAGARPPVGLPSVGLLQWTKGQGGRDNNVQYLSPPRPKFKRKAMPGSKRTPTGGSRSNDQINLEEIKGHIELAKKGMAGTEGFPDNILSQQYFSMNTEGVMKVTGNNQRRAWKEISIKARKISKWLEGFISKGNAMLAKVQASERKTLLDLQKQQDEFEAASKALKIGEREYNNNLDAGADPDEAARDADEAAKKAIASHDKASKPAPAPGPAPAPVPAPVAPSRPIKIDREKYTFEENTNRTLSEVMAPTEETHFPTVPGWKTNVREDYIDVLQDINSQVYAEFEEGRTDGPAYQQMKDIVAFLGSLKSAICKGAETKDSNQSKFADGCKFMKKEYAVARSQAVEAKKAGKETLKNKKIAKNKPSKTKVTRSKSRKTKERCGKAPQGEYGSRGFKPRPNNLRSKARQEKYPEIKKIFDQFYADLDEFGVKITKDFWWGSAHSKAYRRILCKLDEKSAKPKEKESGPVDYKLANKYNANRQRLGVPILTGDQLKADYLSKLIRGGMHMGLSHEESDKLIGGRRKKAAEPVKQQAKPKSLSGKEALEAYESAVKIYNAAKGFTDSDEENMIMMVVEKHISEGTIGALYNMYSRVLRQQGATDRGDLVRELFNEDLPALARKVRAALMRKTRGAQFREGKVYPSKNKVVYAGKSMNLNKLIEHISNGEIKDYKSLKFEIRKKAILESKNNRAVQSSKIADVWILNWLKENIGG